MHIPPSQKRESSEIDIGTKEDGESFFLWNVSERISERASPTPKIPTTPTSGRASRPPVAPRGMSRSSVWLPDGTKRLWPPHDDHGALQDALDEKKRAARAEAAAKGRATGSGSAAGVWQARTTTKWSFKPAVSKRAYTPPPPPPPLKRPTAKGPEPTPAHELHELSTRLLSEADEILSTSAPEPLLVQLGSKCDSADAIKKVVKEWDNKGKGEMLKGALRNNLRNIGLTASGAEADAIFDSWDEVRASALTQCLGALDRARATSTLHSSTLERCLPRLFTPCPAHAH